MLDVGPRGPGDSDPLAFDGEVSSGRYDSFVVRIFTRDRAADFILGQVTHIATRETLRFTNPDRILTFILAHVGRAARLAEPRRDARSDSQSNP